MDWGAREEKARPGWDVRDGQAVQQIDRRFLDLKKVVSSTDTIERVSDHFRKL